MGDRAAFKPVKPGARISEDVKAGPRANGPAPAGHTSSRRPGTGLLQQVQDVLRTPGQPLSAPVRQEMEARFGADFSGVRVHADSAARASATAVGARAYTSGDHVVLGSAAADGPTLAHELRHVIQQREGPVSGSDDGSGLAVSDPSDRFERAAEAAAPGKEALRGGQPHRGGPAHAAVAAPLPIQRLKRNDRTVLFTSMTTSEAEEYWGYFHGAQPQPDDVKFESGDWEALAEALSIKGRIAALTGQIAGNIPRIVVKDTAAGRFEIPNPRPSEQSITHITKEHPAAWRKQKGPFQIWSGTGEESAKHSKGYTLAHTPGHFQAEAMMEAAEGPEDRRERDPAYHLEFANWLERDITPDDLTHAGFTGLPSMFVDDNRGLKKRTFLLGHPRGKAYVEGELRRRRDAVLQANPEAAKGSALEVFAGSGKPWREHEELSEGTSEVVNRGLWHPDLLTGDESALLGLHHAIFQSSWGLVSEQAALGAVRSFTPVASHGIPGHGAPEATIQYQFEIPAIRKEAKRQKDEISGLIRLLKEHNRVARDPRVANAASELQQGIEDYVKGAELLAIDPPHSKSGNAQSIFLKPQREESRKQSEGYMSQGSQQIKRALGRLERSKIFKN